MGIFQRLSDILKSNVNDLIDRAEDPEKMVKQIIIDMQKELNNSTQALGKAVASERIAKKQYDQAAAKSADWESKAKAAIAAGDEEIAKKALANQVKIRILRSIRKCTIPFLSRLKLSEHRLKF